MTKKLVLLLCSIFQNFAFAAVPIPSEFLGKWVLKSSNCNAPVSLNVNTNSVKFQNGTDARLFSNVEACFTCEGGAKYAGIVVWAIPATKGEAAFTIYFNAHEVKNDAVVEIQSASLKSKFPIENQVLRHCKK